MGEGYVQRRAAVLYDQSQQLVKCCMTNISLLTRQFLALSLSVSVIGVVLARPLASLDGQLLRVTTLAATGPGSLHAALQAKGARLVVFEVGGVIDLAGRTLVVRNP